MITNIPENISNLSEMAIPRNLVIDKCLELALRFMEHFHKIYNNRESDAVYHWAGEMTTWFNKVESFKLASTKKKIRDSELNSYFLTGGAFYTDYVKNVSENEKYDYEKFCQLALKGRDNIAQVIRDFFNLK